MIIAAEIQAAFDAAYNQAPINLGTLDFRDASGQTEPSLPVAAGQQTSSTPGSVAELVLAGYLLISGAIDQSHDGETVDGYRVLFGQKRADPNFSTKPGVPDYLKGRSLQDVAADLRSGRLSANQIRIEAFAYDGVLVSTNTRGLAALSLAGKRPTNIQLVDCNDLSENTKNRLKEITPYGDTLPATKIAITEDRQGKMIRYPVEIP